MNWKEKAILLLNKSLNPVPQELNEIDWLIVGGESGIQARPMKEDWVLNIKKQASRLNIPFFFKQWGTWGNDGIKRNKKVNGKLLKGEIIQEMPDLKEKI